jgi:uncharacterized coiled-coil DUF342 family protein
MEGLQNQAQELRTKLNALNDEKEAWFGKKKDYSEQIKQEIQKIKESLKERNELSSIVKEDKKKRDELNKIISEKIKEAKSMQQPAEQTEKRLNPHEIKRQINLMEKKIETEGLSFDKEKQIMKAINKLKKHYQEALAEEQKYGAARGLSKEISDMKKEANETHKGLQEKAKESQKHHETLIAESKKIDDLKKLEKEAFDKGMELKKQCTEIHEQLKKLLPELQEIKETKRHEYEQRQKAFEEQKNKTLQEKAKSVEEKLKSGKKIVLTMEDLLAYQGVKEKE